MQIQKGEIIEGKITGITKYGAFVSVNKEISGMIHISEISSDFIKDINEFLKINQTVKAVVIGVNNDGKLALSMKQLPKDKTTESIKPDDTDNLNETVEKPSFKNPEEFAKNNKNKAAPLDFEDMLNKFKRESDEKMSDLKSLEQRKGGSPTAKRRPNQKFDQ
jgi:S1 RNA binding domain protein